MFESLRSSAQLRLFMKSKEYEEGNLFVNAALCDHHLGFHAFAQAEFGLEANTCNNHHLGIGAANYTHRKYFLSQDNMDRWYDRGVRMSNIGIESIREKADVLMEKFMVQELKDPDAYKWWDSTWSLKSGHGKWSLCHGGYCGYVTNASTEREWREDKEPCSPKASMGEYLGIRFNTIRAKGKEHRRRLMDQKTPNTFMKVPPLVKEIWDRVQELHPKTLILSELGSLGKEDDCPERWRTIVEEIFYSGRVDTPLHLKIDIWQTEKQRIGAKPLLQLSSLKHLFIPKQQLLK